MSNLIHPVTKQPCEFVASVRGFVALRLACTVSPAVQWFTLAQIEAVNPVHTCAEPQPQPYKVMGKNVWVDDTAEDFLGESALAKLRAQPLTVVLTPEMAANVNHVIGVSILVRKPAPITVYHSAMRPAA
jgi:hypothetical protein